MVPRLSGCFLSAINISAKVEPKEEECLSSYFSKNCSLTIFLKVLPNLFLRIISVFHLSGIE